RTANPVVLLWLPVAGVALGQPFLLPGISLADVCLGAFVLLALVVLGRGPRPALPPWAPWLAAFCAWALVGGAWLVARGEPGFSLMEFSKSASKLLFYSAAAVALVLYAALVAHVPYARELACGDTVPCNAAYYYERRWFGDSSPRGLR